MYKKIKFCRISIQIIFALVTILAFLLSWLSYKFHYDWITNLLLGIGASFLASIMFSIFSETTKKKYLHFYDENKRKQEIVFSYYKNIDLGRCEATEAFKTDNFVRTINWVGYFYEKVCSVCRQLENAQKYEKKLKNDEATNKFIHSIHDKHEEYIKLLNTKNTTSFDENGLKSIALQFLNNMEESYFLYDEIYYSVLHNASELELVKNTYKY